VGIRVGVWATDVRWEFGYGGGGDRVDESLTRVSYCLLAEESRNLPLLLLHTHAFPTPR